MLTAALVSYTSKTAKLKTQQHIDIGDVLLGNITFVDFCCFRCVAH